MAIQFLKDLSPAKSCRLAATVSFELSQNCYFCVHLGKVFSALYHKENVAQQILVSDVPLFAMSISGVVSAADPSDSVALYIDDIAMYYISQNTVIIA
jgi:hypothetical protein